MTSPFFKKFLSFDFCKGLHLLTSDYHPLVNFLSKCSCSHKFRIIIGTLKLFAEIHDNKRENLLLVNLEIQILRNHYHLFDGTISIYINEIKISKKIK